LVDLPGYGYAQRGKEGREKIRQIIEDYILERSELTNLFVLIDSRHEPQQIDLEFMEWLGENATPFSIVYTKTDKISKGRLQENIESYAAKMLEVWEELPPIFITSSLKKDGRDEILQFIEEINSDLTRSK
jgi:GTP-binding protein